MGVQPFYVFVKVENFVLEKKQKRYVFLLKKHQNRDSLQPIDG